MKNSNSILATGRAEALFVSILSNESRPDLCEATKAIRDAVRGHGGVHGCASEMAAAYGEYPEAAASRMMWARGVVEILFP
ncbi:hypothetical protein [Actinoplanes aureus]|uniref:Uncharacterized protein n=1 Tax=Actinoplanes aureus TaxID=2792083 RepID=A0A931CEI8_9ACTN|nr:hypothetical protein [Actinoplanes aureus]MBG0568430.1 hypothetical protein [Actinoplanes aureus]